MRQIDLKDFAIAGKKLPQDFLVHQGHPQHAAKGWKIFAAFALDTYLIFAITTTLFILLSASASSYMITKSLTNGLSSAITDYAFFGVFLLTMFGYYFCSFYLNAGQTYGMLRLKHRVDLEPMSLRGSLGWTAAMSFITFSWGALLFSGLRWLEKEGWGKVASHDHLYLEMMSDKVLTPIHLVNELSARDEAPYVEEIKEVA
jgi:uncharacterized RDD family membrane protein YckC